MNKQLDDTLDQQEMLETAIREGIKTVNYNTVDYPLELFLKNISQKQIDDELKWDTVQQSYFIESLLLGLPVLNIVIEEIDIENGTIKNSLNIIDGKQRLFTTLNFINGNLILEDLKILSALNGFRFKNLVPSRQRRIKQMTVRTIELAPNSDISFINSRFNQ